MRINLCYAYQQALSQSSVSKGSEKVEPVAFNKTERAAYAGTMSNSLAGIASNEYENWLCRCVVEIAIERISTHNS